MKYQIIGRNIELSKGSVLDVLKTGAKGGSDFADEIAGAVAKNSDDVLGAAAKGADDVAAAAAKGADDVAAAAAKKADDVAEAAAKKSAKKVKNMADLESFGKKLGKTKDQIKKVSDAAQTMWKESPEIVKKLTKYGVGTAVALAALCLATGKTPAEILKDAENAANSTLDFGDSILDSLTSIPETIKYGVYGLGVVVFIYLIYLLISYITRNKT